MESGISLVSHEMVYSDDDSEDLREERLEYSSLAGFLCNVLLETQAYSCVADGRVDASYLLLLFFFGNFCCALLPFDAPLVGAFLLALGSLFKLQFSTTSCTYAAFWILGLSRPLLRGPNSRFANLLGMTLAFVLGAIFGEDVENYVNVSGVVASCLLFLTTWFSSPQSIRRIFRDRNNGIAKICQAKRILSHTSLQDILGLQQAVATTENECLSSRSFNSSLNFSDQGFSPQPPFILLQITSTAIFPSLISQTHPSAALPFSLLLLSSSLFPVKSTKMSSLLLLASAPLLPLSQNWASWILALSMGPRMPRGNSVCADAFAVLFLGMLGWKEARVTMAACQGLLGCALFLSSLREERGEEVGKEDVPYEESPLLVGK